METNLVDKVPPVRRFEILRTPRSIPGPVLLGMDLPPPPAPVERPRFTPYVPPPTRLQASPMLFVEVAVIAACFAALVYALAW